MDSIDYLSKLPIEFNIFYYSEYWIPLLVHWIAPSLLESSCVGTESLPAATLLSLRAPSSTIMLSDTYPWTGWTGKENFHSYTLGTVVLPMLPKINLAH